MTDESADGHFLSAGFPLFSLSSLLTISSSCISQTCQQHTPKKNLVFLHCVRNEGDRERGSTPCFVRDTAGGRQWQASKKGEGLRSFRSVLSSRALEIRVSVEAIRQRESLSLSFLSMSRILRGVGVVQPLTSSRRSIAWQLVQQALGMPCSITSYPHPCVFLMEQPHSLLV